MSRLTAPPNRQPSWTTFEIPEFCTLGEPEWKVTWFSMPEASMVSAVSTVTTFWEPMTVRLAQWPVSTTVFVIPLTVTTLSLQAIVRF